MEYELVDTGVFDDDRYFDVEVEYAKADPDDIVCRITVAQPGADEAPDPRAPDALVPQHVVVAAARSERPGSLRVDDRPAAVTARAPRARHAATCTPSAGAELLFCENETQRRAAVGQPTNSTPYPKDGINDHVVHGRRDA